MRRQSEPKFAVGAAVRRETEKSDGQRRCCDERGRWLAASVVAAAGSDAGSAAVTAVRTATSDAAAAAATEALSTTTSGSVTWQPAKTATLPPTGARTLPLCRLPVCLRRRRRLRPPSTEAATSPPSDARRTVR